MNYYEHHIGDYAQATAHLSFVEDAAYSRLIRKYYAEEKPLPADLRAVQRLVGARSKEEREAVQVVLEEFFVLEADGWHNKRCDIELAKVQEKKEKARASANARWNGRNASASDPQCERNANASKTHNSRNAHQSPVTSHQGTADAVPDSQQQPANVVSLTPVNRTAFAQAVAVEYGKAYGVAPPPVPLMLVMDIAARADWYPSCADIGWWANYFALCWEDPFLTDRADPSQPLGRKAATFRHLVSEKCIADMVARNQREAAHG